MTHPIGPIADGTDRLLLDEVGPLLLGTPPERVVMLDDRTGALTLGVVTAQSGRYRDRIRTYQDGLTSRVALSDAADRFGLADAFHSHEALDARTLTGATVVLLRLPKSLDALTETVEAVARHADPGVVLYAAGPVKHLTRSMNDVLAASFATVRASLGKYKARALIASNRLDDARSRTPSFPRTLHVPDVGLDVVAHGGVFSGPKLDLGTRFLLDLLPQQMRGVHDAVDLGCGTGILGSVLARAYPDARVIVSDQSAAAVSSATATAAANGLSVIPLLDDALATLPEASIDLIVCNPPFHAGTRLETDAAHRMFSAAARVLRQGGELWTVYNSHLRYRRDLGRVVGSTTLIGQNPKFTVTRSIREH